MRILGGNPPSAQKQNKTKQNTLDAGSKTQEMQNTRRYTGQNTKDKTKQRKKQENCRGPVARG
jgi:hypothetical protein